VGQSGGPSLAREFARFTGRAEHALDDKSRLVVPARFRERLGAKFIVTIAEPDPCLALYPMPAWEAFCERLDAAPVKDEKFRRFVRHLFAHTDEATLDGQGRFTIPPALREFAGIERDAISIGSNSRIEIWSKDRLSGAAPSHEEAAAFTTELGLY
jgi:MraZ protein